MAPTAYRHTTVIELNNVIHTRAFGLELVVGVEPTISSIPRKRSATGA